MPTPPSNLQEREEARAAKCEHGPDCWGPTGTWQPTACDSCGADTYADTCWQHGRRVPTITPVLCAGCSTQTTLF